MLVFPLRVFFLILFSSLAFFLDHAWIPNFVTIAIFCSAIVIGLWKPHIALMIILPMSFVAHPFPASITLVEGLFALLSISLFVGLLLNRDARQELFCFFRKKKTVFIVVLGFLIINYLSGVYHQVHLRDWLRGLVPFVFLAVSLPAGILLKTKRLCSKDMVASIFAAAMTYTLSVFYIYFFGRLWNPLVPSSIGEFSKEAFLGMRVFKLDEVVTPDLFRLTLFLPRSSDSLLPVSVVLCFALLLVVKQLRLKILLLAFSICSVYAVLATQTRSMVIAILATVLFISSESLFRDKLGFKKVFSTGVFFVLVGISFFSYFQPKNALHSRFGILVNSIPILRDIFSFEADLYSRENMARYDVNILARMEENINAFKEFTQSPFVGKGLGSKHPISAVNDEGKATTIYVPYLHNWPIYVLKTSGIVGFILYCGLLFWPFLIARKNKNNQLFKYSVTGIVATLAIYACFFAVFRNVSFNILVGLILGWTYFESQKLSALNVRE